MQFKLENKEKKLKKEVVKEELYADVDLENM
jgi:hypothetical protein